MANMIVTYIDHIILATLALATGYALRRIQRFSKQERATRNAVRSMLRYNITKAHQDSFERGYTNRYMREAVHSMLEDYERLDGNSYVESLVEEIDELQMVDIKFQMQKKMNRED